MEDANLKETIPQWHALVLDSHKGREPDYFQIGTIDNKKREHLGGIPSTPLAEFIAISQYAILSFISHIFLPFISYFF